MSTDLLQALQASTRRVQKQHPTLSHSDIRGVYASYRDHFSGGDSEPPTSTDPAKDDLLLALWDDVIDYENKQVGRSAKELEAVYVGIFTQLEKLAPQVEKAVPNSLEQEAQAGPQDAVQNTEEKPIYQLKITLDGSQPLIWRRLLVPLDVDLTHLHHIIQSAMGWTDSHVHQFYPPQSRPIERLGSARLGDLLVEEGDHCGYEYDFGDSWYHDIELEQKREAETGRTYPVITGGERACPPEDSGGIRGYNESLKVLKDPSHPDYMEMAGWLTQDFNPEAFNIDQANQRLARHGRASFRPVM